jgi:hypothetical protein
MNVEKMSDEVARFLEEANALQWKKNADYHPDKVAFLEIMRTACESGVTVEQDLWGRVRKQMSALRRFVIDGHTESESPRSRMLDVAVYMGMLSCWVHDQEEIVRSAYLFQKDHTFCEQRHVCHRHTAAENMCDRCVFLFWLEDRAR